MLLLTALGPACNYRRQERIDVEETRHECPSPQGDDRVEVCDQGPAIRLAADSVVDLVAQTSLTHDVLRRLWNTAGRPLNLCSGQPFADQPGTGTCSGFLVGPGLVATAGHCPIDNDYLAVFGYRVDELDRPLQLTDTEVYSIVDPGTNGLQDWRLLRLNSAVQNHAVAALNRGSRPAQYTSIYSIGHPSGLPQKVSGNARIEGDVQLDGGGEPRRFDESLDGLKGASGSPVYEASTNLAIGSLSSAFAPDYKNDNGCLCPILCDPGMMCGMSSYIDTVAGLIPPSSSTYFVDLDEPGPGGRADALAFGADGIDVAVSDGERFGEPSHQEPIIGPSGMFLADVTGDGLVDVITRDGAAMHLYVNHGGAFNGPVPFVSAVTTPSGLYFADVDGDGRADAIHVGSSGYDHLQAIQIDVERAGDAVLGTPETWLFSEDAGNVRHGWRFVDVDGDGRADAVRLSDGAVLVARSTGARFEPWRFWFSDEYMGDLVTAFADVDGDGAAELVNVDDDMITVRRAEASPGAEHPDHFGARMIWCDHAFTGPGGVTFADVDGDGKADAIAVDLDGIRVRRSTGTAFGPEERWLSQRLYGTLGAFPQAQP